MQVDTLTVSHKNTPEFDGTQTIKDLKLIKTQREQGREEEEDEERESPAM